MKTRAFLALAAGLTTGLMAASAAHAVEVQFNGFAAGIDPLGHAFFTNTVTPSQPATWSEPGLGNGTTPFNNSDLSSGNGDYATGFLFLVTGGLDGAIERDYFTSFQNVTRGETWTPHFLGTHGVLFTAPTGGLIGVGNAFFVNVAFTGSENNGLFQFKAAWLDGAPPPIEIDPGVPEPATWALMLAGFGLIGATLRRRSDAALTA